MRLPSGDHAGSMSRPSPVVKRFITPPAAGITQMAPWYEKATRSPAGAKRGWSEPIACKADLVDASPSSPDGSGDERDNIAAAATRPSDVLARSERDMTLPPWSSVIANGGCARSSFLMYIYSRKGGGMRTGT